MGHVDCMDNTQMPQRIIFTHRLFLCLLVHVISAGAAETLIPPVGRTCLSVQQIISLPTLFTQTAHLET